MRSRSPDALIRVVVLVAATLFVRAAGQEPPAATKNKDWTMPRTPEGQPDLRGTWTASAWALVPVQDRKFSPATKYNTGDVPAYWYEGWTNKQVRPYLLLDPPGGRIPVRPEAAKNALIDEWADDTKLDHIQSPSELDQWGRCITRGPMLFMPTSYNMGVQIEQTPDHVVMLFEM